MSGAERDPQSPVTPVGLSHLVLDVRDIEASHRFWTEIVGFRQVGEVEAMGMRFYAGSRFTHHELALVPIRDPGPAPAEVPPMQPVGDHVGVNHVAIQLPDREAFERTLEFLRAKGVRIDMRLNHGMTHSVYITDPDGNGVELLYDLPAEAWQDDVNAALNRFEIPGD